MAAAAATRLRAAFGGENELRPPTGDRAPDRIERGKLPPSGGRLPNEPDDFSGIRKPLFAVLAEDQSVVDVDVEYALRPFYQV
jgi:hypothetical protein